MKNLIAIAILSIVPLAASIAQTNVALRVWTAKDGKQVTAKLSYYGDGMVTLNAANGQHKIKDTALSDADREYLRTMCDPYYGNKEQQETKRRAELKILLENARKAEAASRAALIEELSACIPDEPRQGRIGRIQHGKARVNQIVDPVSSLITYSWGIPGDETTWQVMLIGVKTTGLADGMTISLPGQYIIDGTISFETPAGAKRTVLVMRPHTETPRP